MEDNVWGPPKNNVGWRFFKVCSKSLTGGSDVQLKSKPTAFHTRSVDRKFYFKIKKKMSYVCFTCDIWERKSCF